MMYLTGICVLTLFELSAAVSITCSPDLAYMGDTHCVISCAPSNLIADGADFVKVAPVINYLEMINCKLSKIRERLFSEFLKLKIVNFGHNNIKQISRQDFQDAQILEELTLHANNITILKSDTFSRCIALASLDLSENQISEIEKDAFSGVVNLDSLNLSGNRLTSLNDGIFHNLSKMTHLRVNSNFLKKITNILLINNLHLTFLSLDFNEINAIGDEVLSQLKELDFFTVANNFLTTNPEINQPIEHITLSSNKIQTVTISPLVEGLWIEHNFIQNIICAENMAIETLIATNNSLTSFGCIRNMTKITRLNLSYNKISSISKDIFVNLKELRMLDLSYNLIKEVSPSVFSDLTLLDQLSVDLMSDAQNIRTQITGLHGIYLTTTTWNCTYILKIMKIYSSQNVNLMMNNPAVGTQVACHLDLREINEEIGITPVQI